MNSETPPPEHEQPEKKELPRVHPVRPAQGPRRGRSTPHMTRIVRASLLAVVAVLVGVFVAAGRITPYDEDGQPRTMSTHTQLGLPPCNFVALTGKPCPACGMTTSFALLVRGDVSAAVRANWVGALICVLWALTLVWALASAIWGRAFFIPRRRGSGEMIFTCLVGIVLVLMVTRWGVIMLTD